MIIKKILIRNYKRLKDVKIDCNPNINIFAGGNDAGKSTILEALSIITSGKLYGYAFERQLKANLFNEEVRNEFIAAIKVGSPIAPPMIVLEAYGDFEDKKYSGTNNELREDSEGIRVEVKLRQEYSEIYKALYEAGELYDIPVEFYGVTYKYFSGETVVYRFSPIKPAFIDTTRKDYSYIMDRFVADNITTYLSDQEQTDLSTAYRRSRHHFQENEVVARLNQTVRENVHIDDRSLSIDLREENTDDWKSQLSVVVDTTPFEQMGFGTQNTIKVELALNNSEKPINIIMMEEPENNLSFTNMSKLISSIIGAEDKQIFISTHSSYVANKLNLGNLFLVHDGSVSTFAGLPDATRRYFAKLPGYDTLRIVLAEKVVLVEGPTDELIIQRAYLDKYGHLPIEDGIDIIVVDSLAFKRYCDISILLNKKTLIVTDNDHSIAISITEKYKDYLTEACLKFFYETNENLNTIEPSVLEVNCENGTPSETFRTVISSNGSMMKKNKSEILDFMLGNKAEWALRVFEAQSNICYPEYIKNVIQELS